MKSNLTLWKGATSAHGWLALVVLATATCMGAEVKVVGPHTITSSGPDTVPPKFSLTLTITPSAATVSAGTAVQLTSQLDSNGIAIVKPVLWSSSDSTTVSVTASGLATAKKQGPASVTAVSGGVASSAIFSVVAVAVASVTVAPSLDTLHLGSSVQLSATTKDSNGNTLFGRFVTWTSSNPGAVSVGGTGKAAALAAGTSTITATSEGVSGTASVVAVFVPVATVTVTAVTDTVQVGQTITLTAITKDSAGNTLTGEIVTWASSDTTIAKVNSVGQVTGRAVGGAVITATSEGQSGTHGVTVIPVPVASVQVTPNPFNLLVGGTVTLSATARDASGQVLSGRPFTWGSSSPSVATVDGVGTVTALALGSVTITATAEGKVGGANGTVTKLALPDPPTVLPGDVVMFSDDFESYGSTTALIANYARTESHGTVNLDATVGSASSSSFRADFFDVGCLTNADADVSLERRVDGTDTVPKRTWYISYDFMFPVGWRFSHAGCAGGSEMKEFLVFRDSAGAPTARFTLVADTIGSGQTFCPALNSNTSNSWWKIVVATEPGATTPPCGGSGSSSQYPQHLAGGGASDKRPAALADGKWHHMTIAFRKESAVNAGDGLLRLWVDSTIVIDYDGEDINNIAFHQVYTRTLRFPRSMQFPSVFNRGVPQNQSRWFDNLKLWYRPTDE